MMPSVEQDKLSTKRGVTGAAVLLTLLMGVGAGRSFADGKKSAPAPRAAAPKAASTPKPAAGGTKTAAGGSKTAGAAGGSKAGASAGTKTGAAARESKPVGSVTKTANGGSVKTTSHGEVTKSAGGKTTAFKGNNGHEAKFASNGKVKEVHAGNMTITHGPGNMRRSVVENRETHTRFVAEGHGRGYIEHRYEYGGHAYYARGYYSHGGYYRNYYHPYYYGGVQLYGYAPSFYYPSAYYGWAYNPWPAPAPYAWGWSGSPWYGYYGAAYFNPYPVYPSPAFWLTDYMIAATLSAAFQSAAAEAALHPSEPNYGANHGPRLVLASYSPGRGESYGLGGGAPGGGSVALTPEVKKQISDEIQLDLAAQKAKPAGAGDNASVGNLATLMADGKPHVFVAGSAITATAGGDDCNITEGDVLTLPGAPSKDAENANLSVLASKNADCGKGTTVTIALTDVQEMYNSLLGSIDKGLGEMKDNAGKGGIPAPPADATAGSKEAPYAAAAPPPDKDGAEELDKQAKDAAVTEQQVVAEASSADDSGTTTASADSAGVAPGISAAKPHGVETISAGQTVAEVVAMKGQPKMILNPKKLTQIYVYSDMKITFTSGKLTDVN